MLLYLWFAENDPNLSENRIYKPMKLLTKNQKKKVIHLQKPPQTAGIIGIYGGQMMCLCICVCR